MTVAREARDLQRQAATLELEAVSMLANAAKLEAKADRAGVQPIIRSLSLRIILFEVGAITT